MPMINSSLLLTSFALFLSQKESHAFQVCPRGTTATYNRNMQLHGLTDGSRNDEVNQEIAGRRQVLKTILGSSVPFLLAPRTVWASGADNVVDSLDVRDFLRKGVSSNPMGVSGQAGKSRPETGVILRLASSWNVLVSNVLVFCASNNAF